MPTGRFKRYEWKYLLTEAQYHTLLEGMQEHLRPDAFPQSTIRSLYWDTSDYRLIRRSLEKPCYKEKLRLRAYAPPAEDSDVYLELKKKYHGVVYKRRQTLPYRRALAFLARPVPQTQVEREIAYFLSLYPGLRPAAAISYRREAYVARRDPGLRLTFDTQVLFRTDDLSLAAPLGGTPLLPDGTRLMEIKLTGAMPLWLCSLLSRERLYRTGFSKYGRGYTLLKETVPHTALYEEKYHKEDKKGEYYA